MPAPSAPPACVVAITTQPPADLIPLAEYDAAFPAAPMTADDLKDLATRPELASPPATA